MLCEICHEREAVVHTAQQVPESAQASHLCRECFQTKGPITGLQIIEGVAPTCHYCGAQCDFGASASRPVSVVIPGATTACRECGDALNEYVQSHIQAASSEAEFTRNLEGYMLKRVAQRYSET
jgi:protein-arginine kinase activator protein McsA